MIVAFILCVPLKLVFISIIYLLLPICSVLWFRSYAIVLLMILVVRGGSGETIWLVWSFSWKKSRLRIKPIVRTQRHHPSPIQRWKQPSPNSSYHSAFLFVCQSVMNTFQSSRVAEGNSSIVKRSIKIIIIIKVRVSICCDWVLDMI